MNVLASNLNHLFQIEQPSRYAAVTIKKLFKVKYHKFIYNEFSLLNKEHSKY